MRALPTTALQQSPGEQPWKDAGEIRFSVFPLREKAALETTREVSSITGVVPYWKNSRRAF